MSSYKFDSVPLKIAKGQITFYGVVDGDYKLALVTSAAFDNLSTGSLSNFSTWNEVSGTEINVVGSGYNSTGYTGLQSLEGVGLLEVDVNGFNQLKVSANDITFPLSTIDANGAIIMKNDADKTLINAIDFGAKKPSNNGAFVVNLSKDGWIRIH